MYILVQEMAGWTPGSQYWFNKKMNKTMNIQLFSSMELKFADIDKIRNCVSPTISPLCPDWRTNESLVCFVHMRLTRKADKNYISKMTNIFPVTNGYFEASPPQNDRFVYNLLYRWLKTVLAIFFSHKNCIYILYFHQARFKFALSP